MSYDNASSSLSVIRSTGMFYLTNDFIAFIIAVFIQTRVLKMVHRDKYGLGFPFANLTNISDKSASFL